MQKLFQHFRDGSLYFAFCVLPVNYENISAKFVIYAPCWHLWFEHWLYSSAVYNVYHLGELGLSRNFANLSCSKFLYTQLIYYIYNFRTCPACTEHEQTRRRRESKQNKQQTITIYWERKRSDVPLAQCKNVLPLYRPISVQYELKI